MTYLLALDQGTTSSRAILFDEQGTIHGIEQREIEQIYPRPGWVEHDPREIWATQRAVLEGVLTTTGTAPSEVACLGITNQRETTVVLDRTTGEPLHNAIVWQDRRTAGACEKLEAEGVGAWVRKKTGLRLDAYFSGPKIAWILDHVKGARDRAEAGELAFGTIDTWLLWNLTEGRVHATDASNASRTLLYDIHAGVWDPDLLKLFRVPGAMLPTVRASSAILAEASSGAAGVPIAGMAGDQQAALFGQACFDAGQAKNTYGTGCFLLLNTGTTAVTSNNRLLTTVAWHIGEETHYALEGSVFTGGSVVQWLRDGLGIIRKASEVEALARSVDDSGGVVFVPAFTGLGAPHWDPHARGAILGLTRGSTRAHIARAALEAIAFQVADVLDAMNADAGLALPELRVDGGAAANDFLLQSQADLLGVPVVRPRMIETTAYGAACLAGLAAGVWEDRKALAATWSPERRFVPQGEASKAAALRAGWREAVARVLTPSSS